MISRYMLRVLSWTMPRHFASGLTKRGITHCFRKDGKSSDAGGSDQPSERPEKKQKTCWMRSTSPAIKTPSQTIRSLAFVTSGVRLGTAAVTSRGMNTEDMDVIAEAIAIVLKEEENAAKRAKALVKGLTEKYPLI